MSSMTGGDQLDFFEMTLSFLKSVQNLLVPSFLSTTTINKLWGDLDGHVIFAANISITALSIIGCLATGVQYGLNLIAGWLPLSILILIVLPFQSQCPFLQRGLHFVLLNPHLFLCDY